MSCPLKRLLKLIAFLLSIATAPSMILAQRLAPNPFIPLVRQGPVHPEMIYTEATLRSYLKGRNIKKDRAQILASKIDSRLSQEAQVPLKALKNLHNEILDVLSYELNQKNRQGIIKHIRNLATVSRKLVAKTSGKGKALHQGIILITRVILNRDTTRILKVMGKSIDQQQQEIKYIYEVASIKTLLGGSMTSEMGEKRLLKAALSHKGIRKAGLLAVYAHYLKDNGKRRKRLEKVVIDLINNTPSYRKLAYQEAVSIAFKTLKPENLNSFQKKLPMSIIKRAIPESFFAIKERVLLSKKGSGAAQLRLYKEAKTKIQNPITIAKIDIRLGDLYLKNTLNHRDFANYIRPTIAKYITPAAQRSLGEKEAASTHKKLSITYEKFIKRVIASEKISLTEKSQILQTFLQDLKSHKKYHLTYTPTLGKILLDLKKYQEASNTYLRLHKTYASDGKWLEDAYNAASLQEGWSNRNYWYQSFGVNKNKIRLESMARHLHKTNPNNIRYQTQAIILTINNSKGKKGLSELLKLVSTKRSKAVNSNIIGATAYHSKKFQKWDLVIQSARLGNKLGLKLPPLQEFNGSTYTKLMVEAYPKESESLIKAGKKPAAIKLLKQSLIELKDDHDYSEAIFKKIFNLELSSNKSNSALQTASKYLTLYPKGKFRYELIRKSISLSKKLKKHEATIRLMKIAAKDPHFKTREQHKIILELHNEFIKHQEYGLARDHLETIALNPKFTNKERLDSGLKAVDIDNKYGDPQDSEKVISVLSKLKTNNLKTAKRVLVTATKNALKVQKTKELPRLEKSLLALKTKDPEVINMIGVIRYVKAEIFAKRILARNIDRSIPPHQQINNLTADYKAISNSYKAVCFAPNPYCKTSKKQVSLHVQEIKSRIESLDFPANISFADERALNLLKEESIRSLTLNGQVIAN